MGRRRADELDPVRRHQAPELSDVEPRGLRRRRARVAAGEGIAVLPRLLLQAAHPGVAIRRLAADPPIRRVSAYRLSSRYLTPATERFLGLLVGASRRYAEPIASWLSPPCRRCSTIVRLMARQPEPTDEQLEAVYESMIGVCARRDIARPDSLLADEVELRAEFGAQADRSGRP